jgi:CubicO group peptidase (beta-lactamase class C family)
VPGAFSLTAIDDWPVDNAAAGVVDAAGHTQTHGDPARPFAWASVTKPATALATLVAIEEGSIDLDEVAPLLAHASGMAPDERKLMAKPLTRRIYSNAGFEALAEHVAQATGIDFADYLDEAVLQPLGMIGTSLDGSPAKDMAGPLDDLLRLGHELLRPTLISAETHAKATSVAFPGLDGVLPGYGRQRPNDWGLGFEIKAAKSPHWTGHRNSPATLGHFGRSGTFLWVDPVARLACAVLTDREFGPWASTLWPAFSDAVLERAG